MVAALAAAALPYCTDSKKKSDDENDKVRKPVVSQASTGSFEPLGETGVDQVAGTFVPGVDAAISLWKARVTVPAAAFPTEAALSLEMSLSSVSQTPDLMLVSPMFTFRMADTAGATVARESISESLLVEVVVDRYINSDTTVALMILGWNGGSEERFMVVPEDLQVSIREDKSRLVSFTTRDPEFSFAIAVSADGAVRSGYARYDVVPGDSSELTGSTTGLTDEASAVSLTWVPEADNKAGYWLETSYEPISTRTCAGGSPIDPAAIKSVRGLGAYTDTYVLEGLEDNQTVYVQLCSVNGRIPPDRSDGIDLTYELPTRALAVLGDVPADPVNDGAYSVTVGGSGITEYQYELRAGAADCDGATYSEWTSVSTGISGTAAEGAWLLCVLGRKSPTNVQQTATMHAFTVDLTPPGTFNVLAVSSPTNDPTPTVTWESADGAAKYQVTLSSAVTCSPVVRSAEVTDASWTPEALTDGTYYVCLTAADAAGNLTDAANNGGISFVIDTDPPVFTALALANAAADTYLNAAERGASTDLAGALTGSGYDTAGFALAAGAAACDAGLSYGAVVPKSDDAGMTADGAYKVCVRLGDAAGNLTYGASDSLTLDTGLPAFTSLALAGDAADGYINLAEHGVANAVVGTAVTANADVVGYRLVVSATACDGNLTYGTIPAGNSADFTIQGLYKVCVRAADAAGNPAVYGASGTFEFDTIAPEVTDLAAAPASGTYVAGEPVSVVATFSEAVSVSGATGSVRLLLETGASDRTAICTSGTATTTLTMTYTVQSGDLSADLDAHATPPQISYTGQKAVMDLAGNPLDTDLAGATALATNSSVVIDAVPPSAFSISTPTAASTVTDNTPTVTWTDPGNADEYDLLVAADAACATPTQSHTGLVSTSQTLTALTDGDWHICLVARDNAGNTTAATNDDLVFTVATGAWSAVAAAGAPAGRQSASVVWDAVQAVAVFWGGFDGTNPLQTGGRYAPATDVWAATTTTGAPSARHRHTAVWTGSVMVVWGGDDGAAAVDSGGQYDPGLDSWNGVTTTAAPAARHSHAAVWDGANARMVVWGGHDGGATLDTGGRYNVAGDAWDTLTTTGAPSARQRHTAVLCGGYIVIWGGHDGATVVNSGGRYDAGTDTWSALTTTGAPAARERHAAVCAGGKMVIWGGSDGVAALASGGVYDPALDTWTAVSATQAPVGRYDSAAVVDGGGRMVVWGGYDGGGYLGSGGSYDPATDAWVVPSLNTAGAPGARAGAAAVWDGTKMILWGGFEGVSYLDTGARFVPP